MGRNHRLHQQVSQYRQQAEVLTQQLGLMLWRTEETDLADGLELDSDSALGDLASVIEVVQSDMEELLIERDHYQQELEQTVAERTRELQQAKEEAEVAQSEAKPIANRSRAITSPIRVSQPGQEPIPVAYES